MTEKMLVPNKREAAYLRGLAQEALAAEDRSAALLTVAEERAEAATKRRVTLGNEAIRHRLARLKAVAKAQASAKALTDAVADVISLAGQERTAMIELGDPHADLLTENAVVRRISQYLSHQLRQLVGPTSARFGSMNLCAWFRPSVDWASAERRSCAAMPGAEEGD